MGIITLNWVSNHYLDVIKKIYENTSTLESKGWNLEIVWTPGHSEVQVNEVVDKLAKEAATEAKELGEETSIVTVQDVKRHARVSIRYKWQQGWDFGESERDFYLCKPFLISNPRLDYPNIKLYKKMLQLRTDYSKLNDYRHKLGHVETRYCECGQIETA